MNKASPNFENSSLRHAADRFLVLLKTRGPQTSSELGAALGITHEAARQQLTKLAAEGLVESSATASGVGRPTQVWRLTRSGNDRFPDGHAELAAQLLRSVRSELGDEALDRLVAARERETRTKYTAELADAANLRERIARLVAIRSREGYMAEWSEDNDGAYLLVENHCPICSAAAVCQGFCRSEQEIFKEVLGAGTEVTRSEHILAGGRRCAYRILGSAAEASARRSASVIPRRRAGERQ